MDIDDMLAQYRATTTPGDDGASIEDYLGLEFTDTPDPCDGSGEVEVCFGGQVIATVPCPRCSHG